MKTIVSSSSVTGVLVSLQSWRAMTKVGGVSLINSVIICFWLCWVFVAAQATPMFLPGESQGRRSLVGCRLWGRTESDTAEATWQQQQQQQLSL